MIQSLTLKNIATYDSTGIRIDNLKKVNFIYGANGCGKTTITKFIDNQSDPLFCNCSLIWKSGIPIKALVYNKDFRNKNFGKGSMEGVFTLGQATKEEIEAIIQMQNELSNIKDKGIKKKEALEKLITAKQDFENEFRELAWTSIYKKYEIEFKEAFVGFLRKEAFKTQIVSEFQTPSSTPNVYEELVKKAQTIFGTVPVTMPLITVIEFSRLIEIENNGIWQKKIIGKADIEIAKLIQRLNLNDWVNEGKSYLQEDHTCPFCQQQTISNGFRKQLEEYFDDTFLTDTTLVKELIEEYSRIASTLTNFLQQIETSEKSNNESKLDLDIFSAHLKTVLSQFISNREILNNKIKEPSRGVSLVSVKEELENIKQLVKNANFLIIAHNQIVTNYTSERRSLIAAIWKFLVEENKHKIEIFIKKESGFLKGIDALQKQHQQLQQEYKVLNNKVKEANKNVTGVQHSVDEINRTLKSYGFLNFEIVPSRIAPNQYQIHREDGTIAESTLSEGEITFITFLYFLQLSKGSVTQDSISEERVLIVDDPISSLDSNILFVISSLLKQIIRAIKKGMGNIKQIVVFTHNVYFHKEVSFLDGRTAENNDTYYWIVRRNKNVSTIQAYEMKNPIHNSYELLWKELQCRENLSSVSIQNAMRRIIENYFKILGKYGDDDLINKFDSNEEQEICRSLICWINDGSHCIPDDLFIEHHESSAIKYFEV
ncbi:MAG: AAA family ATPase, partial [Chitinophagaceae bacterium]